MRRGLAILLCIAMVLSMAGCGGNEVKSEGKTLVYGSTDYTAINPTLYEHGEINSLLFLGLTAHDGDNNVVPGAAESWKYSEETFTYTFTLREGLTFHDGQPLTAEDVKFTLEAIQAPENGSENASNFEEITGIQVLDDRTVAIALAAPNVAMLDYLTMGILPKHLLEGKDLATDGFNQKPVGAGPYMLDRWDMGQSITLKGFADFFMGVPKIDTVIFKIVPDSDVRALQLKSGELDLAQITPKAMAQLEGMEGYKIYKMNTADYRGILYNFNSEFFGKHRELPNILSYAIDRQAIVDSVLLGYGRPAYSPLQMGKYNNPHMEKYEYDAQKCEALLKQAGWKKEKDGYYYKDGQPLAFEISTGQGDQVRVDMANICAQNFREMGIQATVQVVAQADWKGQDAYLIGWGSPFDPDDHTYKVFGTDKGANYSGYSNAAVDRLLRQAREKGKPEERLPLYEQFQVELAKDLPYTFIAYIDAVYGARDNITGIAEDTVLGHHGVGIFRNVYEWDMK